MKREKSNRTILQSIKIIDIRRKIKYYLVTNNDFSITRLSGIFFGLYLSQKITVFSYDRLERLVLKIEKNQIISLRK